MTESLRLLAFVGPVAAATVCSSLAALLVVRRARLVWTMVTIAVVASAVTALDLAVLNHYMLLTPDSWAEIALVAAYSVTAAIAAALIVGRRTRIAFDRLLHTAQALGRNDLTARAGPINASPELQMLATTLDQAAGRLQAAIEAERRLESQRRDLITSISHDLRTPLSQIRSMVEAIDDGVVDDPATVRRYATQMVTSITTLVEMVEDLFELSQLDAATLAADPRRMPMADVVERAVQLARASADARGVAIATDIEEPRDALCSPKLIRVVHSLVDNAVQYTPTGGTVAIHAAAVDGELRVRVADTGAGIPAEHLARVFDPFWRGDEARSSRGAGLGLALAKRIVEALGGRIDASSTPRVGSCFEVTVPVRG